MFKLPHVPSAEDLVDKAFRAGSKEGKIARGMGPKKPEKLLTGEIRRVQMIGGIIIGDLDAVVEYFPTYEELSEFHQRLLDLRVDKDRYKKSLATVKWCSERVESIKDKTLRKLKVSKDTSQSKEFLGRVGSFVGRIKPELDYLQDVKAVLRSFPFVKEVPTLVVAGIPNAGKSTFVRTLTGSNVKVAPYPFTTTDILIGHKMIRHAEYQIIDSPGILDRPMGQRNKVELQAVLALKYLANVVLFIIDPQVPLKEQLNLLEEIKEKFGLTVVAAVNEKGGELPEGYETFNATKEADCDRVFKRCFNVK
ncbi:MAG: GTPase [Candidatus Altiarchaeota archaeon]